MVKKIFPLLTILLLGLTIYVSQANAQYEGESVYVTKIFFIHDEPGLVSASLLICAGNDPISHPEIVVTSDVDSKIITINGNVKENICRGETVLIKANDPSSITAYSLSFSDPLFIDGFLSNSGQDVANQGLFTKNVINVPDWFSNTLVWYLDGSISETELTSAMKYLFDEKIIVFV